jgi:hypothetical protein
MSKKRLSYVYHHTDTLRLPWILDSGELRPGTCSRYRFEGNAGLDMVWATTQQHWAHSATAHHDNERFKDGVVWTVRITLRPEDFLRWPDAVKDDPAWTEDVIKRFNATSKGDNPRDWHTHNGPLDRSKWMALHVRSYRGRWIELPFDLPAWTGEHRETKLPIKTVIIGNRGFGSMRQDFDDGKVGYSQFDVQFTDRAAARMKEMLADQKLAA